MKIYINFLTIAIVTSLLSCGGSKTENGLKDEEAQKVHTEKTVEITETQMQKNDIQLGKISEKVLSGVLKANGVIDVPPQNLVAVSAKMGGFIRNSDLLQGSPVNIGQPLAVIENQDFIILQQDYLDAQSRLVYQKAEYERQKQLSEENVSAQKIFQQVSAEYNALLAKIKGLEARLSLVNLDLNYLKQGNIVNAYTIYSSVRGIVTTVNVNLGKFVNPQDVLFEITNTEHMHVELTIFEQDIPKVKIGQKIRFNLINQPDKEYTAKVYLINPKVSQDRSIRVHCHIEPEVENLSPNTFLKALIELDEINVKALPDDAFVQVEGKDYIYVLKEKAQGISTFEMVEVQKGIGESGFTEVVLPEKSNIVNQQIVIKGAILLLAQFKNASGAEEEGHAH